MGKLADNDRAIKGCRPKPGQTRTRWTVEGRKGLYVDVSAKPGAPAEDLRQRDDFRRVYYFRDRRHDISERLGDVDHLTLTEAWKAVQARHARTTLHGPRSTVSTTFRELFDAWLDQAKKRSLKSWPHEEYMYERHLKGLLAHVVVGEQRKRDFVAARDKIAKSSTPLQGDKAIALVGRVLNWAERSDLIDEHSAKDIPPLANLQSRDRVFSAKEMRDWWLALDDYVSQRVATVLRLLLMTGLRLSEVVGMERSELRRDEVRGLLWEIPGKRTKSGLAHVVPVTPSMKALFDLSLSDAGTSSFMFPAVGPRGELKKPMSRYTPDHAFAKMALKLGFVDSDGKPNCGVHDLRRTMATELARLKFSDALIDRVQGRVKKSGSITWVYNRYDYLDEKREALEMWDVELARILAARS